MAEVARDYKLYTKIAGAQRIGLFGARRMICPPSGASCMAGFETGQAYAKALRMAKTCVGSTWCRFGVQDSVGLGVFLRTATRAFAPHKMKFGVSGCTRECGGQARNVGIIATDAGGTSMWAATGMKPRHADLLASDLDRRPDQADRPLLMFYIRTADKLQRTSVWLGNLEGASTAR